MAITGPTDKVIDAFLRKAAVTIRKYMLNALTKLGEESIVRIRNRSSNESWIDHTGNLRSSIGYGVFEYGVNYMESAFDIVRQGNEGQSKGKQMVQELAEAYSNTYALVVVAGMEYADKVEAIESKDVLESTRIWAFSVINDKLEMAKEAAIKEINSWKL